MNTWRDQAVIDALKFDIHGMKIQHETFLQHTLRARLFKLYKSRISDSRRACLTNGYARLRDDRVRLSEV